MRYTRTLIPTTREAPKDAAIDSHILMLRAGLVRKLSSGIYGLFPLGLRCVRKVEAIIREEMNRIGGNEFLLPVLIPGDIWKKSGRWYSMGSELFRLKDRGEQDFVLAPTHEEAFTVIIRENLKSYRDLPVTVYHIGPKFRDEIRPRFGVMRGKTFIMKDAYSFHRADRPDSLDKTYTDMSNAYRAIFSRCGLETIPVAADSGTMGGSQSEEFMVPAEIGEEQIVRCTGCGYVANREKASCMLEKRSDKSSGALDTVSTPDVKTIDGLAGFLKKDPDCFIKTMLFTAGETEQDGGDSEGGTEGAERNKYVMALIRGDLDVNETKLKGYLGVSELKKADIEETWNDLGIPLGFAGPVGVEGIRVIADNSVKNMKGSVTGANRKDFHHVNVDAGRDFTVSEYTDLRLAGEGDPCPKCGHQLEMFRGIELGHIFKLGDKYSRSFDINYVDEDGSSRRPIMGCYGIGVERTVAAVIEQNHDENGIVWPLPVAPYQVYILPIKYEGKMKEISDSLCAKLEDTGLEVLLDDRDLRPGVKFKDADLVGIPYRINVGDRGLQKGMVELVYRKSGKKEEIKVEDIAGELAGRIAAEMEKFNLRRGKPV